jgi:hypothetical protein
MFISGSDDMLLAGLSGRLDATPDCLVVVTGNSRVAVAWRAGEFQWDAEAGALEVHGFRVRPGDRIALVGGQMPVRTDNLDNWEWALAPNEACLQQDDFFFAYTIDEGLMQNPR